MKLKPYPEYKDSGVEWIGEIPEEWNVIKAKFEFKVKGGYAFPSNDFVEEGVSLIRIGNISRGIVNLSNCKKLSYDYYLSKNEFLLKEGDIVIAMTGATIGKIGQIPPTEEHLLLNQRIGKIETSLPVYCKYLLNSDFIQSQIKLIADGSAQDNISSDQIENFIIPSLNDLQKTSIVLYLNKKTSQIDKTIEKDTQLIELLKEKRNALINHAVTKGLDPNAKMKDSGVEWIGEIPEGWEVKKLKWVVSKIGSGITPKGGASVYVEEGIALLRSQNIHFEGLEIDDVSFITEEINKTMLNSIVKNHDVLLNITGASIGRCTYFENQVDRANVNQHVCIIRPKKIGYRFLNYILMSNIGQNQIFSIQMGSSREGLNFEQIGNFKIICPPYGEQQKITNYLDKSNSNINKTIQKIERKIELLEEYKKSLIHHVVTGKVDVRSEVVV